MTYLMVGIGGFLGSLTRYHLGKWLLEKTNTGFPYGTYAINLSGAFLLGVLSALSLGNTFYHLLGDGFLGAYTTFSTFLYEGVQLYEDSKIKNALVYILSSLILGIIFYGLGHWLIQNFSHQNGFLN